MGEDARSYYVLKCLESIMLELKSSNNSEVLREIGGYASSALCYKDSRCKACMEKR
jgi:hypothetical protein